MIKVVVDGTVFCNNYQVGIWRTFYEVMNRTSSSVDYTILLDGEHRQPLPKGVKTLKKNHLPTGSYRERWAGFLKRQKSPVTYSAVSEACSRADIFHSSYFTVVPPCPKRPVVVVNVYDMTLERHFYNLGEWAISSGREKRESIKQADAILANSEHTLTDVESFFPDKTRATSVAHLGCDHLNRVDTSSKSVSQPYVLFVGNRGNYKNFSRVLSAMGTPYWPVGLTLNVAGPPFLDLERQLIERFGLTDKIRHVGRVSDSELAECYHQASCFVYPSLAEGFGIPIIEAQLNGCPVVASDIPVFHEIASDTVVYFDPLSDESLCIALRSACEASVASKLIVNGLANASKYTWDDCALKTLDFYKQIAKAGNRNTLK